MASATQRGTAQVAVTPDDFARVMRELNEQVLVERENDLRIATLVLLAGANGHFIGEPGVAKSFAIRQFCERIKDARYFEKPLHPTLPVDAIIGPYDVAEFARSGNLHRQEEGYIGQAEVVFVDEVTRGNGPMTDAMLSFTNVGERMIEYNGALKKAKACAVYTASNHWFAPDDLQAQAFADRITIMLAVEDIQADANFIELFDRHHERINGAGASANPTEYIDLAQLHEAQRQVRAITATDDFKQEMVQVRRAARMAGFIVSPRRWMEIGTVCRANAWMAGRDQLTPDDLAIVEHGLWRDPATRGDAHKIVLPYHSFYEQEASKFREEMDPLLQDLAAKQPILDGRAPNEQVDPEVMGDVVVLMRQFEHIRSRVKGAIDRANGEGRDPGSLLDLNNTLTNIEDWSVGHRMPRWEA